MLPRLVLQNSGSLYKVIAKIRQKHTADVIMERSQRFYLSLNTEKIIEIEGAL